MPKLKRSKYFGKKFKSGLKKNKIGVRRSISSRAGGTQRPRKPWEPGGWGPTAPVALGGARARGNACDELFLID